MNKLAYRKAFADAYEYAMEKIAGCCGGRGGQAMIIRHGAANKGLEKKKTKKKTGLVRE